VYYERLVLDPRPQIERILDFMGLPWDENVLHHEEFINKEGGTSLLE
jgi:protein-tyrosine sulfotransferase